MKRSPLLQQLAKKYRTPLQVQKFIQTLKYNSEEKKVTLRSAEAALKAKTAHCIEAAFIAAALLELQGYPPLILDLESQDGLDHVVFIFKQKGLWGAIGRSRDRGLEGREPVFRSVRDLAWSYFDPYIDSSGKLKAYQKVHLDDTQSDWRQSPKNVWKAEKYLLALSHIKMRSSKSRYKKLLKAHHAKIQLPAEKSWWY